MPCIIACACAEGAKGVGLGDGGGWGAWTEGGVPRKGGGEGHQVAQVVLVSVLTVINDHTSLMDNRHRVFTGITQQ